MPLSLALLAALLYGYATWRTRAGLEAGTQLVLPLALLAHGAALGLQILHVDSLRLGFAEAMSLLAWESAAMLWLFCLREPLQALGRALYPLAAALAVGAVLISEPGATIPLADWKIGLHILFSLLAAGLLTLASLQAIATAALDRALRHPPALASASRLPPLQTMERLLFQMIGSGFALLSCALLTGLLFVHNLLGQHLAHKTVLSAIAWLIFGGLLWGRYRQGWRGRRALRWALSGYGFLVLAYFGSKLVLELVLGRHWT